MQAEPRVRPHWTVLIPAHNEAKTIRGVVEGTLQHLHDVIVIDDGSTDATAKALDGLPVEIIRHERNRGKGWRLAEGLQRAVSRGADGVITLDADGQHDPDDIPAFLVAADSAPGALVVGDRSLERSSMPMNRRAAIRFGDFFIGWAAGQTVNDAQCGLRLYPAAIIREVPVPENEREHFVFETAILLRAAAAGKRVVRVPIRARYQGFQQRPSHFRPVTDTLRIARTVTHLLWRIRISPNRLLIALRTVR
ncbi:glycosyltransferase family 2 protein [Limibaculum sp. M0105]|uniref:Glycosyltransferase family 2 protein n=1 Tax=Thermohalobaculum xanthum TaxID=2753746 RepID=A0A8J7M9S9_9RHOB|nr:glycosyltransferase family 2 protein [Thermohalobaculum xanthum]MBK0400870.1 glycosyltransferase family 2 protein [Thermohalobaculum xanthum]